MEKFDYGIIGGGPAGYTAGINLAKQGYTVVLFEKNKLGGTCLNKGCIPTKSILHSAEIYRNLKFISELTNDENFPQHFVLDYSKVIEKKDKIVEKVRKSLELAVKNSGVKTVYEEACIKDKNTITAAETDYEVKNIIVAAGSKPRDVKGLEFDGQFILLSLIHI